MTDGQTDRQTDRITIANMRLAVPAVARKNWEKIGEGFVEFSPQTDSILLFRPRTTVQNFMNIE